MKTLKAENRISIFIGTPLNKKNQSLGPEAN